MYQNVSRLSPNENFALNRQVDYSNSGGEDRKVYKNSLISIRIITITNQKKIEIMSQELQPKDIVGSESSIIVRTNEPHLRFF